MGELLKSASIGFSSHSGWAAAVCLGCPVSSPFVLDRPRLLLTSWPLPREPYHDAKRGGGTVVSISSSAGVGFKPYDYTEYAAAKAGVMRMTASLGRLKEQMGISVNCICPGWVATEAVKKYLATASDDEKRAAGVPDPMLTPQDIGEAVLHFVREGSLAGRIMLYHEPGKCRIIPSDLDLFELSEEVSS